MLAKTCGPLLKQLNDVLTKKVNNELRSEGLTMTQMRVLVILDGETEKKAPLKEIERQLAVAQSTVVGICHRLAEKHFISYLPAPGNRRAKWIQLTEAGQEKCNIAYQHMHDTEAQLLGGMNEREKREFYRLLEMALDNVR